MNDDQRADFPSDSKPAPSVAPASAPEPAAEQQWGLATRAIRVGHQRTAEGEHCEPIFTTSSFVFANAGASLATIDSLSGIASPRVVGSFVLLGLFALVPTVYQKIRKGRESRD